MSLKALLHVRQTAFHQAATNFAVTKKEFLDLCQRQQLIFQRHLELLEKMEQNPSYHRYLNDLEQEKETIEKNISVTSDKLKALQVSVEKSLKERKVVEKILERKYDIVDSI